MSKKCSSLIMSKNRWANLAIQSIKQNHIKKINFSFLYFNIDFYLLFFSVGINTCTHL